jgi:hypothetical protein
MGLLRHHGVVYSDNWRPVVDQVSLFGSQFPSPISSLSLPISFSVGQRKARKINERKEEKGKKVPVAKKKDE